jgi:uncharacterized protein with ParB-like and HNH nuclease domain
MVEEAKMANGIQEPKLKSIGELLSGSTRFQVPIYQRSFDWGKDEIEELWEDICLAVGKENEDYSLETIVLQSKG